MVVVWLQRKDQTSQIGLLKVADGSMRILKSLDWRGPERLSFSPDGKYLGFDVPVSDTDSSQRDVFVIAVDGSREHAVVQRPGHDRMMGWSADGRTLLFASDRTGTLGLWGTSVVDGAASGAPFMIKSEIAPIAIGTTRSGALFTMARIGTQDVKTAAVDVGAGRLVSAPESAVRGPVGVNRNPQWSPDGKSLAYGSARGVSGRDRLIVIRSLEDGRIRELRLPFHYAGQFRWAPDSRAFIIIAKDPKGRNGIYRIDAQTGAVSELVGLASDTGIAVAEMSPDGSKLYYYAGTPGSRYVERDIQTGSQRMVFADRGPVFPSLSPDGKYLAGVFTDESFKQYTVELVTVSTGERKEIYRASEPVALYSSWTPDGQHVLVPVREKGMYQGLLVPVSGAPPQRLAFEIGQFSAAFHPDGRQIAFTTGRVAAELWVLENFLPPTRAAR
jgi:Tol biopolymer transport system component